MTARTGPSSASWPMGQDLFALAAPGWRGFDPAEMLDPQAQRG
jgi:hypothetical protein